MQRERQASTRIFRIAALSALMVGVLVCDMSVVGAATSSPAPVVTSLSPSSGPEGNGSTYWGQPEVVIHGSYFSDATAVQFGALSLPASQFVVVSTSEIS